MKYLFTVLLLFSFYCRLQAQNFVMQQRSNMRAALAFYDKEDTLKKQFEKAGLQWPAKQIYIRSFKYDSQLEVWVRNSSKEAYKLFKTYKVCALSGALGPKRVEGDYQVPEGFYYINEFKPTSNYHLALGLNYPNASDAMLSDSVKPGGDIYIHGSCITVGCIPIQNEQIEEVYIMAAYAKSYGMDFIPVHIFPVRYNVPKSVDYFLKVSNEDKMYQKFAINIKEVFDYFELHKKLPIISINKKGEYVVF
ncbi:L,D-transpeptidase family protein [Parasediminibacterium sp. JCM 36343]|uniref:L,D-transpeptidase family protein n=1 Tax=Parasediminibacterium sp. JCM 36343 TaxID=3374279 RepID=UPI003979907A